MDWPGIEPEPPRLQVRDKRTNKKSTVLLYPLLHRELTKLKLTEESELSKLQRYSLPLKPLKSATLSKLLCLHTNFVFPNTGGYRKDVSVNCLNIYMRIGE
jgi:hypothetical protein